MSQVIHAIKDNDHNIVLFLYKNDAGLFTVQWGEMYSDPFPPRWKTASELIRLAMRELQYSGSQSDITSMANFILGYFPEGLVALVALENS